ncbi:hypothetical protein E1301_Tti022730 [Triplophysa tibetana]|uniref:Uncharacterized protein n=1 Tax=Triplophysa tibetana TaxID=1572043 RepID=A0A5A9NC88_9TELE|nr:hypothetical protein E1301_Tti022730 [Triplophysa tibetana]
MVPVGPGFSLLLYPGSVLGSSKPQRVLIPVVTSEHNIQQQSGPQTDHGRADSDSSEEEKTAQVIYFIPVSVESSNMGVMEGTAPNPDPGHLHVQTTSSSPTITLEARPEAQRQLGEPVGPETVTERPYSGKRLIEPNHGRGMQPELSVKQKALSPAGNTRQ